MKSLLNLTGSKIFKYHNFTEEEPEYQKTADVPFLLFSDEDLIVKRPEPKVKNEKELQGEAEELFEGKTDPDPVLSIAEKVKNDAVQEAERIVAEAGEKAKAILEKSGEEAEKIILEAEKKARELFAGSEEEGYKKGYEEGVLDGNTAGSEQARRAFSEKLKDFFKAMDDACESIDLLRGETIAQYLKDLTELVLAISERIVCISLESSSEVIKKMILSAAAPAIDKQWAKVTISAEDAKSMLAEGIDIKGELYSISDKIDLNIVDDAILGTCLVEFPDQVIDAGAGTQLRNIKEMVRSSETE